MQPRVRQRSWSCVADGTLWMWSRTLHAVWLLRAGGPEMVAAVGLHGPEAAEAALRLDEALQAGTLLVRPGQHAASLVDFGRVMMRTGESLVDFGKLMCSRIGKLGSPPVRWLPIFMISGIPRQGRSTHGGRFSPLSRVRGQRDRCGNPRRLVTDRPKLRLRFGIAYDKLI